MSVVTNDRRTILGPLTTLFEPPASCSVAHPLCSNCGVAWVAQTCASQTVQDNPSCWPTTTAGAKSGGAFMLGWGFYSPGVICPAGHTSACQATAGGKADWKNQYVMEPEETFVGCCPTGFQCHNENGQTCISEAIATSFATVYCINDKSNDFGYMTVPKTKGSEVTIFAPMIQLAWKPTDEPLRTAISSANSGPSSRSISSGAIAGIAVGSTAFLIGILIAIFFVWRSKRRAAAVSASSIVESQESGASSLTSSPPAELKNHTFIYTGYPQTPEPGELRTSYGSGTMVSPVELGMDGPVELPGPEASPRELMHRRMFGEDDDEKDGEENREGTPTAPTTELATGPASS